MISVIPVEGTDSYNLVGIEQGAFVLQGNLTKKQLVKLQKTIDKVLK